MVEMSPLMFIERLGIEYLGFFIRAFSVNVASNLSSGSVSIA